jgi:hypothetical protein
MTLLPNQLPFGNLEIDEIWLSYDGPRLFTARNALDNLFLFNTIDEDEDSLTYLAVPISTQRKSAIRSGVVGLRAAFVNSEAGWLYRVVTNYVSNSVEVDSVVPDELTDEELPTSDYALSIPTATLPLFDSAELGRRAVSQGRTLLALRLNPLVLVRSEYPARQFGDVLNATQSLADSLVQEESGRVTAHGPLPRQVIDDAELSILDLQAASFVAILAPTLTSASDPRLEIEMTSTTNALRQMSSILLACSQQGALRELIPNLGPRSITKVRNLLELALDQGTSLGVYLAVPNEPVSEVHVSTSDASIGLLVLTESDALQEEVNLDNAILIGVNLRTWRFELFEAYTEPNKFSGKILDSARQEINGLPTGEEYRYVAVVVADTEFSDITDEVKIRYSLKSIRPRPDVEK